jgi:hypothetical protein
LHHTGNFVYRQAFNLGGTTDAHSVRPNWDERCIFLTKTDRLEKRRNKMNTIPQVEPQETNVQERAVEVLTDNSLPAAQVIEAQSDETEEISAPRFIP